MIVIDREAFANPLFAESVHQIQSAFEEADFPGPSGYASELHTDLGPGDHIYDLARNEAFARVKPFAAALRERLWR